jgi:hypothetical protein
MIGRGSSASVLKRASAVAKIAPIEARTAFGRGVGGVGADRHAGGAERVRGADDRADVARIVHAPQRDRERPADGIPALLEDGDQARSRAELRDLAEQRGRHLSQPSAAPARPGAHRT